MVDPNFTLRSAIVNWLRKHGPARNGDIRAAMAQAGHLFGLRDPVPVVDRALQRLRKAGKIHYHDSTGWQILPPKTGGPSQEVLNERARCWALADWCGFRGMLGNDAWLERAIQNGWSIADLEKEMKQFKARLHMEATR